MMPRFRIQDLNDSVPKRYWFDKRAWFGWYNRFMFQTQVCVPYQDFKIEIQFGGHDNALGLVLCCPLFFWSLTFECDWLRNLIHKITSRKNQGYSNSWSMGIAFFGGILWVSLWEDHMAWHNSDPKWWKFNFHVEDWIKGKQKYTEEIIETREILIPMPEKSYPATAIRKIQRWSRPRWKLEERMSVNIDIPNGGIPHEGKGENSWDCGVDATHGMSCPAQSIPEAVGKLVGSVLKDRVKYGGWSDWTWSK